MQKMEETQKYLEDVQVFLEETEKEMQDLFEAFNWTEKNTLIKTNKKSEPVEQTRKEPTGDDAEVFPESGLPEFSDKTVTFDKDLQLKVIMDAFAQDDNFQLGVSVDSLSSRDVPQSSKEMLINFTRDERLAMYDYVIQNQNNRHRNSFGLPSSSQSFVNEISNKEISKIEKDFKRKKAKHYVEKGRPFTYTEEIRNLIAIQTAAIEENNKTESDKSKSIDRKPAETGPSKYSRSNQNANETPQKSKHNSRSKSKDHKSHRKSRSRTKTEELEKSRSSSHKHKKSKKSRKHHKKRNRSRSPSSRHNKHSKRKI